MFFSKYNLEYVSHDLGLIFPLLTLLHELLTQGCYRPPPLGENSPQYSMTPTTSKTVESPWIFITYSIYNDQLAERKPT